MISIIVIVKSDRRIEKLLAKLETIKRPEKTEIIVVDASEGKLDDIRNKFPHVRWVRYVNNTGKRTTIPEQRNVGIRNAKGEIIVFIDSDCIPDEFWLDELVKPIRLENEFIVAGRVTLSDKNNLHHIEFKKNNEKKYLSEAPTMNLALKKKIFDEIGLFDVNFQCGEDVDLLWRATKHAFRIRYMPKANIYHDLGSFKNEIRRMHEYGRARISLYRKHNYRWRFLIHELQTTLYPLYFIFLPITLFFKPYPLLILPVIIKYFNKKPHKIIVLKTIYGIGMMNEIIHQAK